VKVKPARSRRAASERATRQRVFDVATELFAEHGFKRVTVRRIAEEARANVAAVNYHFGDKAGLYSAIVDNAIRIMQETGTLARQAGEGLEPSDRLRAFVHVFLTRITGSGHLPWIHRLMTREMDDPTEMLARIMREVIVPRTEYLSGIVEALTGLRAGDPRVLRAVVSIQGQVLMFGRPLPANMPGKWGGV
jgi:AcrR family transcriptional regulator